MPKSDTKKSVGTKPGDLLETLRARFEGNKHRHEGLHRYGTVFIYHNGADSYYAARGFRCSLSV